MEIVLLIESQDLKKAREILLKDDHVSRASITFKDAKALLEKTGYYIVISGSEEHCKRAIDLTKGLARVLEGREKQEVIDKIREEENKANVGFGNIFG